MPSPFPGMDPYLEGSLWSSFHGRLIVAILDQLNPRLPKRFIATNDLYIWRLDEDERLMIGAPDGYVADRHQSISDTGAVATLEAPVVTMLPGIEKKQRYAKILDKETGTVVTVIEILSPANKTDGENGKAYRSKRDVYLGTSVSLIEIDLLRTGRRPPLGEPEPPPTDYCILVHPGWETRRIGLWPLSVRDRFPLIPIPLTSDVPLAHLDLKECFDHVYDFGRFAEQVDYSELPKPPLREPDATWAKDLLAIHNSPENLNGASLP